MVKAVRFHETGGPDVLRYEDMELDPPGPGEAQVRNAAIGLNFIDCYYRSGLYPVDAFAHLGGRQHHAVRSRNGGIRRGRGSWRPGGHCRGWRSSRLRPAAARRLRRGAQLPRRTAGQAARHHRRPHRRRDDVKGSHRPHAAAPHLRRATRRSHPVSRRSRRRRLDRLPMGQAPRRHGNRNRRFGRKGRTRPRPRM